LLLLVAAGLVWARDTEADILDRWDTAGPEERRRMSYALDRIEATRRFTSARPVLVLLDGELFTLARLFHEVLEPPLQMPMAPQFAADLGLTKEHRRALAAFDALRKAYAPPRPVSAGTLNLLLGYAHRALTAEFLPAQARLRFFAEILRNVRALEGRVEPNRRTAWLIHNRLLPSVLGLARRFQHDEMVRESISQAASILYIPSLLDSRAQELLAPLTRGSHSRRILKRAYRQGVLDRMGLVALARSVVAQTRDDPAFAAGASPLILELLLDPRVPSRERGALLGATLDRLAPVALLRPAALDLLAAGYGGGPRPLAEFAGLPRRPTPLPHGARVFRFLSVVLVHVRGKPPAVVRVVRQDVAEYAPIHVPTRSGERNFVGVLVPAAGDEYADFLGPPPGGLSGARDRRLLRRTLRRERIAIHTFGTRDDVLELCVALPQDASEPVPAVGAELADVLGLVAARLDRTDDEEERADLVRLLARVGTDRARELALRHAASPGGLGALVPMAEAGDAAACDLLLRRLTDLEYELRERALAAALATARPELEQAVKALCSHERVGVAVLAADALLLQADISGVYALLEHKHRFARAAGAALALRVSPIAGHLRVSPSEPVDVKALAARAGGAFTKEDGAAWTRYAGWLKAALHDAAAVRKARRRHVTLKIGKRAIAPVDYAGFWLRALKEDKYARYWPDFVTFLLSPVDPGRGIPDAEFTKLLDAIEAKSSLRQVWIESLLVLACAQHGMEADTRYLDLAHERLSRVAGDDAPPGARRKAGVYWPIWAAGAEG